ncbi:type II toxin-antitoxin system VapC family toxin [Caminibacter pacificus]|uniref:Nucleic acid-binding protein n=1 Tax=Caminibacter pacificus TaxID=1424653 RepID=A0AAJ4RCK7_9BACT|nr:PIN domain-containing protein [Caminibacter pacificus]QCI27923.1 PIN domain-containing protein [Caminibacter pacificus]ROR39899.1 putative nucleic acid-binding protein [Caminibacter pacificus]
MDKIFLDTNIIIDLLDSKRKNHTKAKNLFIKLIENDFEVFISEDMITTIYYILKGNEKILEFFEKIIEEWNIVGFGKDTILESINYCKKHKTDLEDVLQCICAKNNGCELFITNDKKFINCGIKIVNYDFFNL